MEFGEFIRRYDDVTLAEASAFLRARGIPVIQGGGPDDDDKDGDENEEDDDDDESGKNGKSSKKTFTQSELEAVVKDRLSRDKKALTAKLSADIRDSVIKEMELKKAEEDGDLKKVIEELRPKAEKLTQAEKLLATFEELSNARFDEAIAQLPDSIKAFAPDDDAPALEKERWLILKATPAMKKLKGKKGESDDENESEEDDEDDVIKRAAAKRRGNAPRDPAPGGKSKKKTVEEIMKGYQSTGQYRSLT